MGQMIAHRSLHWLSPIAWATVALGWPALLVSIFWWCKGLQLNSWVTAGFFALCLMALQACLWVISHVGTLLSMRQPWPAPVSQGFAGWGSGWALLGLVLTLVLDIALLRESSTIPQLAQHAYSELSTLAAVQYRKEQVPIDSYAEVPSRNSQQNNTVHNPMRADAVRDTSPLLNEGTIQRSVPRKVEPTQIARAPDKPPTGNISQPPLEQTEPNRADGKKPQTADSTPSSKPESNKADINNTLATRLVEEARKLDKDGKTDEAVSKLEAAFKADPASDEIAFALSRGYMLTRQYNKENQALRKALELQPKNSSALLALGDNHLRLNQDSEATIDEAANYYLSSARYAKDQKSVLSALRKRANEDGSTKSRAAARAIKKFVTEE
jgi:tetratricopeptide (TPR) repeat protein